MKPGSMRYWLCVSLVLSMCGVARAQKSSVMKLPNDRHNEFTLGTLRPGKSTIREARQTFDELHRRTCEGDELSIEADKRETITVIRATKNLTPPANRIDCFNATASANRWKTGKGLSLGAPCERAVFIYGEPTSRSPSTKSGQPLELLYYAFDWAGPDVPQVMEVVCTAPKDGSAGRVVEITLAANSL